MEWWELLKWMLCVLYGLLIIASLVGVYACFFKRRQQANEPPAWDQLLKSVAISLAASPLLLGFAFFEFALEVFLQLGHWPSYKNPNPRSLGCTTHELGLYVLLMSWPVAPLLAVCLAILARIRFQFPVWRVTTLAALSSGALIAWVKIDPAGVFDWFFD
jgi:hypothetical protein